MCAAVAARHTLTRHSDLFLVGVWDELPQLLDRAAAVAAVLAELEVHRNEPVLITLPEGPGFVESFAGVVDQEALPLPAGPLLSASELAAAAAARARVVLASLGQLPA